MTIDGVSARTSYLGTQILNLQSQFDDLQQQLTTQKKSGTYAGLGPNEGFAIGLRSQVSAIDSFTDTITNVNVRIGIANDAVDRISQIGTEVKSATETSSLQVTSTGQTTSQANAANSLVELVDLLNSQSGDRYLFSGRATDTPSTASVDAILNGVGPQAGLKQVIAERNQADLGTSPADTGRLVVTAPAAGPAPATPTSITITEDAANSPFGLKLQNITSSSAAVAVTPPAVPAVSPATESLNVTGTPNPGDTLAFAFSLPDGSSESINLTASSTTPLQAGQYLIGATPAATASNINAALTTSIGTLTNGALVAASAIQASREFFTGNASGVPLRVVPGGAPPALATAVSLTPGVTSGTGANTVEWYTGETGTDSARGTATAQVDQSVTVSYGARANEQALTQQLQTIAAFAAVNTSPTNPNAGAVISALYSRVGQNLVPQPGQQTIQDIETDFAGAQQSMKDVGARQTQTKATAQDLIDGVEGISTDEVSAKILAVQTALNASFQTTSMLFQTTLLKYLPIG
jgi:hypothetical protein